MRERHLSLNARKCSLGLRVADPQLSLFHGWLWRRHLAEEIMLVASKESGAFDLLRVRLLAYCLRKICKLLVTFWPLHMDCKLRSSLISDTVEAVRGAVKVKLERLG